MISVGNNVHPLHTDKMHFCTFPGHNNELRVYNSVGVVCLIWYAAVSPKVSSEVHYLFTCCRMNMRSHWRSSMSDLKPTLIRYIRILHRVHSSTSTISYTLQHGYIILISTSTFCNMGTDFLLAFDLCDSSLPKDVCVRICS